jgi:hypothetical protein
MTTVYNTYSPFQCNSSPPPRSSPTKSSYPPAGRVSAIWRITRVDSAIRDEADISALMRDAPMPLSARGFDEPGAASLAAHSSTIVPSSLRPFFLANVSERPNYQSGKFVAILIILSRTVGWFSIS